MPYGICPFCGAYVQANLEEKRNLQRSCANCGNRGYRDADDYKKSKRYCFKLKQYLVIPEFSCDYWESTD